MKEGWLEDPEALPPAPFRASMAAVSPEGIIGLDGGIPWDYASDRKRLWRLTRDTTIILGRLTWDSLPRRPMRRRRNIVISRGPVEGAESFRSLGEALAACDGTVWFLGGARIYEDAMDHADFLDLTYVPDRVRPQPGQSAVYFPEIDEARWLAGPPHPDPGEPGVVRRRFVRRRTEKRDE